MYKFKQSLVASLGLFVLIGAIAFVTPLSGLGQKVDAPPSTVPPPLNVKVVNTPLPVTGTVSVGNLGTSPLSVRDVDNRASQPFFENGDFTVPVNKRLVLHHISSRVISSNSCFALLQLQVNATQFNDGVIHIFPYQFLGGSSGQFSTVLSEHTRIDLDAGSKVTFSRFGNCLNAVEEVYLSGYLLDLP